MGVFSRHRQNLILGALFPGKQVRVSYRKTHNAFVIN